MYKIDSVGATANNEFRNASDSTTGTVVDAEWLNAVQEEIISVIEDGGEQSPAKGVNNQMRVAITSLIYPVGSMYVNFTSNTDPSVLLGVGNWKKIAQGRFVIGVGDNGESEYPDFTFGGSEDHKHLTPVGAAGGDGSQGMRTADTWPYGSAATTHNVKADNVTAVRSNESFYYSGPPTAVPPWISAHIWYRIG